MQIAKIQSLLVFCNLMCVLYFILCVCVMLWVMLPEIKSYDDYDDDIWTMQAFSQLWQLTTPSTMEIGSVRTLSSNVFDISDIEAAIGSLKFGKATGFDGIVKEHIFIHSFIHSFIHFNSGSKAHKSKHKQKTKSTSHNTRGQRNTKHRD